MHGYGISRRLGQISGGVFEIFRDGDLIFSKRRLGRFPEPGEIVDLLG